MQASGFGDVEVAGVTFGVGAVPIEDAVGGVGVLLDLVDEKAGTDGVEAARFDKYGFTFFRSDRVDLVGDCSVGDGLLKSWHACGSVFEADVEF